jgi:hypothetical protein
MMSKEIWMCSVMGRPSMMDKQGARAKYFGRDWPPASFKIHASEDADYSVRAKHKSGIALKREEMTEAMFVFDHKHWKRTKDFFMGGNFYAVRGQLAKAFQQFDLGDGGLFEFPIYEEDKVTPISGGPFYLLNFGCVKDTLVIEESQNLHQYRTLESDGYEKWEDWSNIQDGDIVLRADALQGCDLWFENKLRERFFVSGPLHDAIEAANSGVNFYFTKCRLAE